MAAFTDTATAASASSGFFIPKNTRNQNYDAAFKFASWAAGPEGQKILAKGNKLVPNQSDFGMGEYADSADRLIPGMWSGAYMAQEAEIGDYTYFTSLTWITEWSMTFNSDVREGKMTVVKKYRGNYAKCLATYVKDRLSGREDLDTGILFITQTKVTDDCYAAVKEAVAANSNFNNVYETIAGCTVSCHCGPGTLGVIFVKK